VLFKENVEQNFEISFLLCALFTLEPNSNLFKKLNIKKNLYLTNSTKNNIIANLDNDDVNYYLYNLLNKPSLRLVSEKLLAPILNKNSSKQDITNLRRFKKYLRKFKYVYKRYFTILPNKKSWTNYNNKINYLAVKALFLVAGI